MIIVRSLRTIGQVHRPRARSASGAFEFSGSATFFTTIAGLSASGAFEFSATSSAFVNPALLQASGAFEFGGTSAFTEFTPDVIAGLQLWLDASDALTLYNATSGGSLVAPDGAVARWDDKSGNNRHATQATSSARPLRKTGVQNGNDVLRFDGLNDNLDSADWFSSSISIFVVVASDSSATQSLVSKFNAIGDREYLLNIQSAVGVRFLKNEVGNDGAANQFVDHATTLTGFNIIAGAKGTTDGIASANGVETSVTFASSGVFDGSALWKIGAQEDLVNFFKGDIAEVLIYNRALSTTERSQVEEYLQSKWATPALP